VLRHPALPVAAKLPGHGDFGMAQQPRENLLRKPRRPRPL
jgi:hypothetical protein